MHGFRSSKRKERPKHRSGERRAAKNAVEKSVTIPTGIEFLTFVIAAGSRSGRNGGKPHAGYAAGPFDTMLSGLISPVCVRHAKKQEDITNE